MGKPKNRRSGVVFSTDPDYTYGFDDDTEEPDTLPPSRQNLRITRQRLKGNKMVTRILHFEGSVDDLKRLGKELKQHCGCGGSQKDGEILLQGDFRDKVGTYLTEKGYRYKFSGG